MKPRFGFEVHHNGQWKNAAEDGVPCIYATEQERDEKRAEFRRRPADKMECSGNPNDCPENDGYGCCEAPNAPHKRGQPASTEKPSNTTNPAG